MPTDPEIEIQPGYFQPSRRTLALFLISVLGLFLEMLLIRWIGTEVRIFAYLQNTVLIVVFLGLGIGCFTCRQPVQLAGSLVLLAILLLLMAVPFIRFIFGSTSDLLSVMPGFLIWGARSSQNMWLNAGAVIGGLVLSYLLLIFVVDIFVPIGRILGRLMDDHPKTIWAYSVNIAGSLVGTWLFVLLSLFYLPPLGWFAVLGLLFAPFVVWDGRKRWISVGLLALVVLLAWPAGLVPGSMQVTWSPYQKLVLSDAHKAEQIPGDYLVTVNNTGYQAMIDLSEKTVAASPEQFTPKWRGLSQYDIPLLVHPAPRTFLVVGAGTGNDVAGGLRHGVKRVTAVEIDPAIIGLGAAFHPEHPYDSPAVRVVNDDARSFFATTDEKFDVISFGLLDSHTTTAMTNARLDHYVYTKESIARAKTLLTPGGVMTLTFEAQKPYIADRINTVLTEVFGETPIAFRIPASASGWGGMMFITGDLQAARAQIAQNPRLSALIDDLKAQDPVSLPGATRITTDDWPYIYLESPRIPLLYILLFVLMALVVYRTARRWKAADLVTRWRTAHWHFFFLGAAFLLLEVQNISKASVVLGNTWAVNAVIVSGVLLMILLANLCAASFPRLPLGGVYFALIGVSVALFFLDLAQFAFLPYATKAVVVGGLTTLPMLFSGIVFIRSFTQVDGKNEALGANLVGSIFGALLQSVTFIIGIKALLLVVAGLYLLALLTRPAAMGGLAWVGARRATAA